MGDVDKIVLDVIKSLGGVRDSSELLNASYETKLFNENLDSVGVVMLVADLESEINDILGVQITLADDRAMSQARSPFIDVRSLINYVEELISLVSNQ